MPQLLAEGAAQARRGLDGFVVFFICVLTGAGGLLGPPLAPGMLEANARWLWAAIGLLVACPVAAISATIEAAKVACPICGTHDLRREASGGEGRQV